MGTVVTRDWLVAHLQEDTLPPVNVGIDVGQIQDNTAISVAEVMHTHTGKYRYVEPMPAHFDKDWRQMLAPKDADPVMVSHYHIRHITRLPLGTSYPDVALHIADMLSKPIFAHRRVRVFIDVTGVGRPVFDDLRREVTLRHETQGILLRPITFAHGEKYNRVTGILGKAYLVSRLQSLLQGRRVHAPDTEEVRATLEELKVYEIKITDDGKDTYGASVGKHDDLATALGLSCLEDPHADKVAYTKRVY